MSTRSVAKGIPPRKHQPQAKSKAKGSTAKDKPKNKPSKKKVAEMSKRRKRTPSEMSESEKGSESELESDHPEPKRKKFDKRRRIEEIDSEVEVIDEDEAREDEVDDIQPDIQEVSTTNHLLGSP